MANWKRGRTAVIGAGAAMLLALGIAPASAHYVYQQGDVYDSSSFDQCIQVYAESSHGESGDGYMKGVVGAYKSYDFNGQHYDCSYAETSGDYDGEWRRPSQNIEIRDEYFRLNNNPTHNKAFPKDWSLCEYSDWYVNGKTDYQITIAGEMQGPSACGNSYYGTLAAGKVNNGGWLGGTVWSGGHKLPASPSAINPSSSPGDVEVNPTNLYANLDATLAGTTDGELATDGMINPPMDAVTIAGPDGNPVINPLTGQPFLVDLATLNTPPTDIPANAVDVATDLSGNPITVINHLPTTTGAGARVAPLNLGTDFYVVPSHIAAEAALGVAAP